MLSKSGRDSSLRIASRRNVLPASVPRASTRRLTDEMRRSGGSGVPSCATTLSPGLFGFQNNSEKFRADHRLGSKNGPAMNCAEEHTAPVRRRYPRYEIDTELHVTTPDERAAMRGRSLNISEGGTAGVFAMEWRVGASVQLEFSVPVTSRPIRVGGILRSRSGYRYGFEFVGLSQDQREVIGKTCRTLALLQ